MQCACAIFTSVASSALQHSSTVSHKKHDFEKNLNTKSVLIFYISFFLTLIILRRTERDILKMYIGLHVKNLEFSEQIFEKCLNTKFHENPSGGSRDVAWEQTDGLKERHDEDSSGFSQFYELV